ncbi:TPA: hypothetical protein JAJ90_002555 [Corynebacterium striatum]|nr:hypothetical protein [Corynebacterium striatum]NHY36607.1 hypothetical protein [Corynebacterium striatum]HAT6406656.1 hypothetical protein [Corynebacterium striatum]HAT6419739.1 hypothetical protein [Corynebacterium striatum]HAT6434462.1 hypothetical protein [Corynebacterium striatum]
MFLVVGSARGEATCWGIVAFHFPSVRLCAGGGALRILKTIPPYSAPATGVSLGKWIALNLRMRIYTYAYISTWV